MDRCRENKKGVMAESLDELIERGKYSKAESSFRKMLRRIYQNAKNRVTWQISYENINAIRI